MHSHVVRKRIWTASHLLFRWLPSNLDRHNQPLNRRRICHLSQECRLRQLQTADQHAAYGLQFAVGSQGEPATANGCRRAGMLLPAQERDGQETFPKPAPFWRCDIADNFNLIRSRGNSVRPAISLTGNTTVRGSHELHWNISV
jgi:hypothetical protein